MPVMEALPLRANPPAALLDLSTAHLDTLHTLGQYQTTEYGLFDSRAH
jgi:hypothetical protein